MVESIEELPPKLDACPLGDSGRLEERHVQIVLARPVESVSPFARKGARSARGESREVPKARQLIVEGSAAGQQRGTAYVHSLRTGASQDSVGPRKYCPGGAADVLVSSLEAT